MPSHSLPLNDFLVIAMTAHRAGPTAVRKLADWGAQVIKIEPSGELVDATGSRRDGPDFQNLHRNKRAMTLNLKSKEGHAIFMNLSERADVIVENYKSDVKHRLGIDYEAVRKINPRIVYGSISGFGQDGPYAGRAGVDQIAQGMGGLMSITGHPRQGPVRGGIAINDTSAGLQCASRRDHSPAPDRLLGRAAQQGGRAVRADQFDRPDLRRSASPASRDRQAGCSSEARPAKGGRPADPYERLSAARRAASDPRPGRTHRSRAARARV